ncbi:unnamed protein product, partial [Rotaria sordida]
MMTLKQIMLHEVFNIFSNLNSRFAAIMDNLSLIPVYLGLNGMNTLAIDNGLWLAEYVSTFINLRHLSLIDIKRSSFELILDSSPINSLIVFSVSFSINDHPAAYTFIGVPEGAYYERIFHVFPSLH